MTLTFEAALRDLPDFTLRFIAFNLSYKSYISLIMFIIDFKPRFYSYPLTPQEYSRIVLREKELRI